jgi:cell division protein FtsW
MELIINQAPPASVGPDVQVTHQTLVTRMDRPLLYTTLVMVVFGLAFIYSASAHQTQLETGNSFSILIKQVLAVGIGMAAMMGASKISFTFWRRAAKPIALAAIALLLLTLFLGETVNGSERWIALPFGFQFQPSDVAKLAAVVLMAQVTSQRKLFSLTLCVNLILVGAMILLIYEQPNLSVSMIIAFLTLTMLFIGGLPLSILLMVVPASAYYVGQKIMATEYQRRRITGWLNPWGDQQDTGYNLIQSYYAIGSGGFFGTGFGHSIQKMYYLPFPYTDFIFSVICEELGLFGALIVVGLFGLFAWRGFSIAFNCPSNFGQMLAFGVTTVIILQAAINLSVAIGLMPVTGVTLPFISYGGSSMVVTLLMVGILLNVSRYKISTRLSEARL